MIFDLNKSLSSCGSELGTSGTVKPSELELEPFFVCLASRLSSTGSDRWLMSARPQLVSLVGNLKIFISTSNKKLDPVLEIDRQKQK